MPGPPQIVQGEPDQYRRRRPAPAPPPPPISTAATRERPAPGLASYTQQAFLPERFLDPWHLPAASGESLVGWMARRYGMVLDGAGWRPDTVAVNVVHDLATMPLDDRLLSHVLKRTAPLQDDVAARVARRNAALP